MQELATPPPASPMEWAPEVALYSSIVFAILFAQLKCTRRPVGSLVVTSVLAVLANVHFWGLEREYTKEWLSAPSDWFTHRLIALSAGYMLGDTPQYLFYDTEPPVMRFMYVVHHISVAVSCFAVLTYNRWGHMILLGLTGEITNILLNGRAVFDFTGVLRWVVDLSWLVLFFGMRMCFVWVIAVRMCWDMAVNGEWFELLVMNQGTLCVSLLHIDWSWRAISAVLEVIRGSEEKERPSKKEKATKVE